MRADKGFDTAILVFARAPVPGRVKTRLAAAIGDRPAATLHDDLMLGAVATAVAADIGPVTLCCTPDTSHPRFQQLAIHYGVALAAQHGTDLGQRMHGALAMGLNHCKAAMVIGSDCPFLDEAYLREAAGRLARGRVPVVIGPAVDGGYVLLGVTRLEDSLFRGVPWGEAEVLDVTRQRLQILGWKWHELAPLNDIDRPEDLELLKTRAGP